jgi:hypothetical protein
MIPGSANSARSKTNPKRNQNNSALNQSICPQHTSLMLLGDEKKSPFFNSLGKPISNNLKPKTKNYTI